jgi:hypothetical protein
MLLGSPLYMSPEQMRSSKNVDERSDLWALGAIAFELLTGRVPFEADTILELCFKVAQEKPPSPREFRDDLPEELCLAVLKCLEKDPGNRFPNVGELARAFEPFALPRDRGSAERALDVLGTGKRPPMRSVPSIAAPALASSGSPSSPGVAVGSATPTPGPTPAPGVPQMTPSQVEPVAPAAWGTTQAQHAAKSRRGMFAIAGGVVVVAALAGVMVSRKGASDSGAERERERELERKRERERELERKREREPERDAQGQRGRGERKHSQRRRRQRRERERRERQRRERQRRERQRRHWHRERRCRSSRRPERAAGRHHATRRARSRTEARALRWRSRSTARREGNQARRIRRARNDRHQRARRHGPHRRARWLHQGA